ncbi:2-hydroxyacid dehydrogenase [Iodobacter sp. HSC-16F04]|uniref:2-hydroxyacid dehydrogenase n=1 Tax=Iodobacter violaceini TaxID=3044271 RepID=A0ABX0KRK5_9NEIS|nr:2-hydroxyacid dehydrogenase [Iodobacter violacea]NHQ87263.1 2-hydroxyacid dehydrogenase [Iodobacter violacea]
MRIAVFDSKRYDRATLSQANEHHGHELVFFEDRLNIQTAALASGFEVVCPFVNDRVDAPTLTQLAKLGVQLVALRCAGFNGVDLAAAAKHGISVTRVPAYSPEAVAEHVFALLLTLTRKTHRAYNRIREGNFSLDGLVGFNLHGRTFGVVGAGKIGAATIAIARGFGCKVLAFDRSPSPERAETLGCTFVSLPELLAQSDIISLHTPLTNETKHMINAETLAGMKPGAVIINTSRGGLIDSSALLDALKSGQAGGVGLDVYEYEEGVFFEDLSGSALEDDVLARLTTFPNVMITSHQGFLTAEALENIADTVLCEVSAFARGEPLINPVQQ